MNRLGWGLLANAVVLLGAGLVPAAQAQGPGWGLSQDNPVPLCKPQGQRAWIGQLRCPDGSALSWQRVGGAGPRTPLPEGADVVALLERYMTYQPLAAGEADHHMVDRYQVDCGGQVQLLYLDMYHCDVPPPQAAPAGLQWAGDQDPAAIR